MKESCIPTPNYDAFNEELSCNVVNESTSFIERDGKKLVASKIKIDVEMIGSIDNKQLSDLRIFVLEVVDAMNNSTFDSAQINYKEWGR